MIKTLLQMGWIKGKMQYFYFFNLTLEILVR